MGYDSLKWCTAFYFSHVEDATGYTVESQLGGVASLDSQDQAEHDTYAAMGAGGDFYAADEKIGVLFGAGADPISPGPGVTWTLQRRIPHAGVYSLNDATKEGVTDDPHLAKLYFWRDDRVTEDLTLNFDVAGVADVSDYTAIMKTPDGDGGFTEEAIDLAGGTITIPAGTFADPIMGVEVDITATDDSTPEWTENLTVRLSDDDAYVADHPNDNDGNDSDGDGSDEDPDAVLFLKDNDLSFDLQQGMLVANYNDSNNNNKTDYFDHAGNDDPDDPDLYEMTLHVPSGFASNTRVMLQTTDGFFNIYDSPGKNHLLSDSGTITWDNPAQVPHTLWLEVKQGSTIIDDITETLSSTDNGDEQDFEQHNTAINLKIIADADPNRDGLSEITNMRRKWLVGQVVDQHVQIDCPPEWKTNVTYKWDVPGTILRDYIRTDALGNRISVTDDEFNVTGQHKGYTQPAIDFYWESSSAGVDSKTVSVKIGGINGGATFTVENTYAVQKPTVSDSFSQGTEDFNQNPNPTRIGLYGAPADAGGRGMLFRSNVLAPEGFAAGRWNFLQLWNQNRSIIDDIDGPLIAPNNALWGIDNEQLYPAYVVNDGYTVWAGTSWPAAGTMHATVDTPSQGLGHLSYASINDQFIMYVMFMPPGGNSKWVPLRSLYWAFAVNATKNVGAWQLGGGNYHNAAGWKTEATSPEWTITHVNNSAFVADP